jgi:endonuclease YncB( thermonuclease family)
MFQFMPGTGPSYGLVKDEDYFDPDKSTHAGAKYMSELLKRYGGNVDNALAAYNAGMGNVDKYGGVPPFEETQGYVKKIKEQYDVYQQLSGTTQQEKAPQVAQAAPTEREQIRSILTPSEPSVDAQRAEIRGLLSQRPPEPLADPRTMGGLGSKQYQEYILSQGGLPSIRPTGHQLGSPTPTSLGEAFPEQGPYRPFDETYPLQYKVRVHEVVDADTINVVDQSGQVYPVRLPDVNAAETDIERAMAKYPNASNEELLKHVELGRSGQAYLSSMIQPGDQLTIETRPGGWEGKYGRDIGKIYWTDSKGSTIDVSTPYAVQSQEVVKESDPLAGDEPGWIKGLWSGFAQDAAEIGQIPWHLRDLYDWFFQEGDAYQPESSPVFMALDKFRQKHKEIQADWVAQGYDPDAKLYDIPLLGKVTAGEVAKASASATTYAIGILPLLNHAKRATQGLATTIKFARPSMTKLQDLELSVRGDYIQGLRRFLAEAAENSDAATKQGQDAIQRMEKLLKEQEDYAAQLVEPKMDMTAVERMRYYKDLFMSAWKSKHDPLMTLAKIGGKETEMRQLLNSIKAASDVARSPITRGVYKWSKLSDGSWSATPVHRSLQEVWGGVESTDQHIAMMWMAHDRVGELAQWWAKDLAKYGSKEAALKAGKKTGERIIEISAEQAADHAGAAKRIEEHYRKLPMTDENGSIIPNTNQWDGPGGVLDKINETREWLTKATLDVLEDVGALTGKQKAQILEKNKHYAPFYRMDTDFLRGVFSEEELLDLLRMEREMLKGSADVAPLAGKGLSAAAAARKQLHKLGAGLEKGKLGEMIVDPMQAIMIHVPAINRWADQQRVRNMVGELIDTIGEAAAAGAKGRPKWVARTTQAIDDTTRAGKKAVERAKGTSLGNAFVTMNKVVDENGVEKIVRKAYLSHDPNLVTAMQSIDPSHMNVFKAIAQTSWGKALMTPTRMFRAGTVLGMHFMVRNPVRDQVMAATLTKYGYVPVVDWWKGLLKVISNHPVYDQMHSLGGSQANFINATLGDVEKGVIDMGTGQTLGERLFGKIRRGGGAGPEAEDHLRKGFWRSNKGLSGLLQNIRNSGRRFASNAGLDPNDPKFARDKAKLAFYSLRRISEIFEEATRVGAGGRAAARAQKGKKYTFMRSVDEGLGGLGGMARMIYDKDWRKGFRGRFQAAHRYTPEQMAHMKQTGVWLDPDAIDEIRNITLDFQTHGRWGEGINALYPFFNAELQDYARFSRALKEAPLTTMLRGFTFISIPAIANWYMNFDNPKYQELPAVDKELFLHPWGYNEEYKKFGRVSRPIGTVSGFFGLTVHKMLDWMAVNDPGAIRTLEEALWPGEAAREARDMGIETMHQVTGDIPPAIRGAMSIASMGYLPSAQTGQVGERNQGDWRLAGQPGWEYTGQELRDYAATNTALRYGIPRQRDIQGFMAAISPQPIAPLFQAGARYDPFYDTRIVPPSLEAREMMAEDVYTESTSPIERALSSGLNKLLPWDINPIEAGYVVRRYTGSLGAMLLSALDATGQSTGMFPKRPEGAKDFSDRYAMRAFYSKEPFGSNSESVRQVYNIWREGKKLINSMGYAENVTGDVERMMEIIDKHPELLPTMLIQDAVKSMGEIYDERAEIRTATDISEESRADMLFQYDQLYEAMRSSGLAGETE